MGDNAHVDHLESPPRPVGRCELPPETFGDGTDLCESHLSPQFRGESPAMLSMLHRIITAIAEPHVLVSALLFNLAIPTMGGRVCYIY